MLPVRIQKDQHGEQPRAGIAEAQRDKRGVARRCVYGAAIDQGRKKRADHHAGDQLAPAGGKRPRSSISSTIVMRDGHPLVARGSPGGSTIITTVLQCS